jgi:hypothetical protein
VQDRGSQGDRASSAGVGALKAPSDGRLVEVEVEGTEVATEEEAGAKVEEGVTGGVGESMLKSLPVVTVTSAPSVVGP